MSRLLTRFAGWAQRAMPTHQQMAESRWIPAQVLQRDLWRFNRRSVPRGVALGVLVGILLPFAQIVFSALLCFTVRANVPVAALTTFLTNPFTTPFIWALSYKVGGVILHVDSRAGGALDKVFSMTDFWAVLQWVTDEGKVLAFGLVVVAVVGASISYLVSGVVWRIWVAHKRRTSLGKVVA
ncbi:MAG: hypothetical protein RLZZ84_1517 [Pseudomonadota bacterium]|jgi:uncharacterized protein (DUF2062 family)